MQGGRGDVERLQGDLARRAEIHARHDRLRPLVEATADLLGDRVALERATVRGPAQPGQTARHPLAHPRLALEVIDGGAAPARA